MCDLAHFRVWTKLARFYIYISKRSHNVINNIGLNILYVVQFFFFFNYHYKTLFAHPIINILAVQNKTITLYKLNILLFL